MIDDEESDSCILYTEVCQGWDVIQRLISFYDTYPTCDGDLDITNDDILEIRDHSWLSDAFVFCRKKFNDITTTCYIKINTCNQIEEIGLNLEERLGCELSKRTDIKQATNLHKILFSIIGDEYWLDLYRIKHENKRTGEDLPTGANKD